MNFQVNNTIFLTYSLANVCRWVFFFSSHSSQLMRIVSPQGFQPCPFLYIGRPPLGFSLINVLRAASTSVFLRYFPDNFNETLTFGPQDLVGNVSLPPKVISEISCLRTALLFSHLGQLFTSAFPSTFFSFLAFTTSVISCHSSFFEGVQPPGPSSSPLLLSRHPPVKVVLKSSLVRIEQPSLFSSPFFPGTTQISFPPSSLLLDW